MDIHLPNEVLLSIFGTLSRPDLKSSRLVSQSWRACASVFLFKEMYVSSVKEDLEAFESVARDPLLSRCVRHLKYDATQFVDRLSKQQYIRKLYCQRPYFQLADHSSWNTPDSELNEWVNDVVVGQLPMWETIHKFKHSRFIRQGHLIYRKQASNQHAILKNGHFLERLTHSLGKLMSLKSVTVETSWPYLGGFEECRIGSYVARNWHPFHCRPESWRWGKRLDKYDMRDNSEIQAPDGIESYRTVVTALARAHSQIASFQISVEGFASNGLPPPLFDMNPYPTRRQVRNADMAAIAMSKLERCILNIAPYSDKPEEGKSTPELFPNVVGLPLLLSSMDHLRHLELWLPDDLAEPPTLYSASDIFPSNKIWSTLKSFVLVNVSTTARDLLLTILYQTPCLQHLEIGGISFSERSWEAFFEALAQSKHLSSFRVGFDTCLFHHEGADFWKEDYSSTLYDELEEYVICGGRHPCLEDDKPDSAAGDFLQEFDPLVRKRLFRFHHLNSEPATS